MAKVFNINKTSSKLYSDNKALKIKVQPFTFDTTGFLEMGTRPWVDPITHFPIEKIYIVDASKRNIFANRLISLNEPQKKHFELQFNERKISFGAFAGGGPEYIPFDRENFISLEAYKKDKVLKIQLNDKFHTNLYDAVNFKWLEDENFNPSVARRESIQRLKTNWKDNSSDGTETGTINGKSLGGVLGTNWESDFANYNTREEIGEYENQLREKIFNVKADKEIKIKFTVKKAEETREQNYYDFISLKISTDFLMSTLVPRLDLMHGGSVQDAPFSEIAFIFNDEQANSETYEMLADSEGEELELSFNLSKIYFEIYDMVNLIQDKPKIVMGARNKQLEVFFTRPDAPNIITIQKISENPDQDDTPKLNDLTNLLDQALSPNSTKQDKITALKKAGEFLGFISPENQAKITQINQALANNPTQLSQVLSEKIEKELTTNNLTINDLPPKGKTIYQNIKNGSLTQSSKIQAEEQKLTQIIGETGAKKNLDHLETQIQQVLSSSDLEAKKRLQKLLRKFLKNQNTFYQTEKPRAQRLNQELKKSIRENDFKQNSGIPWGKVLPFAAAGIGFFLIILLIINLSRSPRKRKYPY